MNLDAGGRAFRTSMESEMVDIDLEGGKREVFDSPRVSGEEMIESKPSPRLISTRTPSPAEMTPRVPTREDMTTTVPPSVLAATSALRRSSPILNHSGDEERDRKVIRNQLPGRSTRESSVLSIDSQEGLLEDRNFRRSESPPIITRLSTEDEARSSMKLVNSDTMGSKKRAVSGDSMVEISLDADGNLKEPLEGKDVGIGMETKLNGLGIGAGR